MVRLISIETISAKQDFEKDYGILAAPVFEFDLHIKHLLNDVNSLEYTISYLLDNLHGERIMSVTTKTTFTVDEAKANFYIQYNEKVLELLCNLAAMAQQHNQATFAIPLAHSPISDTNLFQIQRPDDFLRPIAQILRERGNRM